MQQAAFALLKDRDIGEPFQDEMGWHLLRRESFQAGGTPPFEEVQDNIRRQMTTARVAAAAQKRLASLMDIASIQRMPGIEPLVP